MTTAADQPFDSNDTCVNCGSPVWKWDVFDDENVVCASNQCGLIHVRESSPFASLWVCRVCGRRDTRWCDDGPRRSSDDPTTEECPTTYGEHDWTCVRKSRLLPDGVRRLQ